MCVIFKFPWAKHGETVIGDSHYIIRYAMDHWDVDLDKDLTPEQKAVSKITQEYIDQHMAFVYYYARYSMPCKNVLNISFVQWPITHTVSLWLWWCVNVQRIIINDMLFASKK